MSLESFRAPLGAILLSLLPLAGCQTEPAAPAVPDNPLRGRILTADGGLGDYNDDALAGFDFGGDFETAAVPQVNAFSAKPAGPPWGIVLKTFSHESHEAAARTMISQLPRLAPFLGDARVVPNPNGSVVAYGAYETPDDPRAQADLQRVRDVEFAGRPAFARAYISRVVPESGPTHPHDLRMVRKKYPKIRELYTVDVAVWIDVDDPTLPASEVPKRAEAYVAELRGKGFDAWFMHDHDKVVSTVTVGLFDASAYDREAGLLSPDVERLMDLFEVRLNNGEPLYFQSGNQKLPQRPALVSVP